ncbi:MAG: PspC domain-containing protein [Bacteroidota bacterium]
MNKIFNINLGGYPFTIDDDAYRILDNYLITIKHHFSTSEGCEDILSDIEDRMAELFTEQLHGRKIIGSNEVEAIISIMGRPEDFGADDTAHEHSTSGNTTYEDHTEDKSFSPGKKLFRDQEEGIIGGVCAGLSAYFGIANPVWIRLLFVGLTMMGGSGVLLYILLYVVVPKATTAGDKLAMRGEPINVSNIAKTIEKEVNNLGDTIVELTKDFGSSKKKR